MHENDPRSPDEEREVAFTGYRWWHCEVCADQQVVDNWLRTMGMFGARSVEGEPPSWLVKRSQDHGRLDKRHPPR